jgi:hypothetical protein
MGWRARLNKASSFGLAEDRDPGLYEGGLTDWVGRDK